MPQTDKSKKEKPKKEKERPKKLTFKHQYALKELPKKIEALTQKIEELELQLGDPDFFLKDSLKAKDLALQLESAKSEKDACENEWLEIELLREELDSQ